MADWPQAGCNAQRTAHQPGDALGTTFTLAWRLRHFSDLDPWEEVFPQVSVIVSNGHVLVPTLQGKLRSFTAGAGVGAGDIEWVADVGAPIQSSVAADGTNVYCADTWGRISAFKLSDGTAASGWSNPVQVTTGKPVQGSLLLADSKLIISGTDGYLYGHSLATGAPLWACDLGAPVLQGAAWSNATGTGLAVVGDMAGRVAAVNSATGALVWQTSPLFGAAGFPDYWPVIDGPRQKVVIRPWQQYPRYQLVAPPPIRAIEADWTSDAAMTAALAAYDDAIVDDPTAYARTLFVLDLADGSDDPANQIIHYQWAITQNGSPNPIALDKDNFWIVAHPKRPGTYNAARHGWGLVNPTTRKFISQFEDATTWTVDYRGFATADENMCVSSCANGVLAVHAQEMNAAYTGFYHQVPAGGYPGAWYPAGQGTAGQIRWANLQSRGTNPFTISGGVIYHNCHPSNLIAQGAS